jgi:phage terminase small subunit
MPITNGLSAKQALFAQEYLIDLNAAQAAVRAGYSQKTARQIGDENLSKPAIKAEIARAMQARASRTEITADRVLKELGRIAFFDIRKLYRDDGTMKAVHELDDDAAAVLAGVDVVEMANNAKTDGSEGSEHIRMFTKKAKIPDKVGALNLAMRHLSMLTDKTEHTGAGGGPIKNETTVTMTPAEAYKAMLGR